MENKEEVVLNPGRREVYDLFSLAVNDSTDSPGQTFADILTASIIIGTMAKVDMSDMQDLIDRIMPNAQMAAEHLEKEMASDG